MEDILKTITDNYVVIIIIVLSFIFYLCVNRIKGFLGEIKASNVLSKLPKDSYKIMNDLMFYSDNRTHQIDHVVISRYGIFVIEMKNYQGKVEGDQDKDKWVQYIGSKINTFYNPVKQNYGHMRCLSDVLKLDMRYFIPVIVFPNETYIDSKVKGVVHLKDVVKYIMKFKKDLYIDVDEMYGKLKDKNITSKSIRSGHVKNLKSNVKNDEKSVKKGICPKCGSKMTVKKENGSKYFACKSCKYTKDL